jgi:hypothetical protein
VLEHVLRLVIAVARHVREELATAQDIFVGGEVRGGFGKDAVPLETGELYHGRSDDASGDVVLHAEDVLDLGIICFGPDVSPGRGLDQLRVDPNAIAGAANATIEQVARVEQAPDLGRREVPALELKARRFGEDEQVRESTQRSDDVLGDPVAKEILAGIA